MPDLSVVIVSYNTRDLLDKCLTSIDEQRSDLDIEIIVVENDSHDGSAEMLRAHPAGVILIEPGRNIWAAGGNNLGIEAASGEYTLILNPDTIILPGTLPHLLGYLRQNPDIGALSCRSYFPGEEQAGQEQQTCSRFPQYIDLLLDYTFLGFILPWQRRKRQPYIWYQDWDRRSTRAVEVIPGSFMLFPTALLNTVGAYDDRLKLYFVEDDLNRRVRDAGYKIHFVAEVAYLHVERASTTQVWRLATQIYFDDLLYFSRKYYGAPRSALLRALILPTRWAIDWAQRWRGEHTIPSTR